MFLRFIYLEVIFFGLKFVADVVKYFFLGLNGWLLIERQLEIWIDGYGTAIIGHILDGIILLRFLIIKGPDT